MLLPSKLRFETHFAREAKQGIPWGFLHFTVTMVNQTYFVSQKTSKHASKRMHTHKPRQANNQSNKQKYEQTKHIPRQTTSNHTNKKASNKRTTNYTHRATHNKTPTLVESNQVPAPHEPQGWLRQGAVQSNTCISQLCVVRLHYLKALPDFPCELGFEI